LINVADGPLYDSTAYTQVNSNHISASSFNYLWQCCVNVGLY
jgi:hypothetical protein